MITIQDLYNIIGNRIANETQKSIVRNAFPPQIAEKICNAIDRDEKTENLIRIMKEWMKIQQKQLQTIQEFLQQYNNR